MSKNWDYFTQSMKVLFPLAFLLYFIPNKSFSQTPSVVNRVDTILFNNFLSNQNNIEIVAIENRLKFFNFFKVIKCISGNLYFSGDGFPGIVSIKFTGNNEELEKYFNRCISGSKFTLENCSFYRDGGMKPIVLSKTVLFQ